MIPPKQSETNWTAISAVIAGILAVINIAGWFVVNCLTKRRERQRDIRLAKEKFESVMAGLRAKLDAADIGREDFPDRRILTSAACEVERSLTAKQKTRLRAVLEEYKQYENHSWDRNPAADLEWATSDRATKEKILEGRSKILREFLDKFSDCVH